MLRLNRDPFHAIFPSQFKCNGDLLKYLSVHVPSQWEMVLHCNVISHWWGAYTKMIPVCLLWLHCYNLSHVSIENCLPRTGISILKIRQPWDCLGFGMGNHILVRWHLYVIEWPHNHYKLLFMSKPLRWFGHLQINCNLERAKWNAPDIYPWFGFDND